MLPLRIDCIHDRTNIARCHMGDSFELRKRLRLQGIGLFLYSRSGSHYVIATNFSCLSRKIGNTPLIWRSSLPKYNCYESAICGQCFNAWYNLKPCTLIYVWGCVYCLGILMFMAGYENVHVMLIC